MNNSIRTFSKEILMLAQNAEIGFWVWDIKNDKVDHTGFFKQTMGFGSIQIGENLESMHSVVYEPDLKLVQKHHHICALGQVKSREEDFRLVCNDGKLIWVREICAVVETDEEGNPIIISGIVRDITEIKKKEERLCRENEHRKILAHMVGLGGWDWDAVNDVVVFDEDCLSLLDRTPEEMNGSFKQMGRFMHHEDMQVISKEFFEYLKHGEGIYAKEVRATHNDGREEWFLNVASVTEKNIDGNPTRVIGGVQNIDKAVRSELKLKQALEVEEKYNEKLRTEVEKAICDLQSERSTSQAIYDSNPHINAIFNDKGELIDCNPKAVEYFGLNSKEELLSTLLERLNKSIPEYLSDGRKTESISKKLTRAMEDGYNLFSTEFDLDGTLVPFNVIMKRIPYGDSFAVVVYLSERTEADELVQLIQDAMPLACCIINKDFQIVDCNMELVRLTELSNKYEYLVRHKEFLPEFQPDGSNSVDKMRNMLAETFEKGHVKFNWTYKLPSGKYLPAEVTIVRLKWRDSYMAALFFHDLRPISEANQSTKEAEERAQVMLDETPLACYFWDNNLNLVDCNKEAINFFKAPNKEHCLKFFSSYAPKFQPNGRSSKEEIARLIEQGFKDGYLNFEFLHQLPDGEFLPTEITLKRIKWNNGDRLVGYARDLRDIKRSIDQAEKANLTTSAMFESAPYCSLLVDDKFQMLDCNPEAVKCFGFSSKEKLLENFLPLIAKSIPSHQPDGRESIPLQKRLETAISTGYHEFETELAIRGRPVPFKVVMKRIPYNNSFAVVAYLIDLYALRTASDELQHQGKLLRVVNKVAKRLLEVNQDDFDNSLLESLKLIGETMDVDRVYVWQNFEKEGKLYCRQLYEWSGNVEPQQDKDFAASISYDEAPYWKKKLLGGNVINSLVRTLPTEERSILEPQDIVSILIIPIFHEGTPWGFIGFDECEEERTFSVLDEQILQSAGVLITSAVLRYKATQSLLGSNLKLFAHKKLLMAVNEVAYIILRNDNTGLSSLVEESLQKLGESVDGVTRVSLWRNFEDQDGNLCGARMASWTAQKYPGTGFDDVGTLLDYKTYIPSWDKGTNNRKAINSSLKLKEMSNIARDLASIDYTESLLLIPIIMQGEFWGFIAFAHDQEDYLFTEDEKNILSSGAMMIVSAIMRNEIRDNMTEVETIANTDNLTKIPNRHNFLLRAEKIFQTHKLKNSELTLLFFDIDHFKKVNDEYGHFFGDEVLKRFANTIKANVRPGDLACRYGGEEFLMLLNSADSEAGKKIAKRIMNEINNIVFEMVPDFKFTTSIGIISCLPKEEDTLEDLINKSDLALYAAKKAGRNRIIDYADMKDNEI